MAASHQNTKVAWAGPIALAGSLRKWDPLNEIDLFEK